MSNRGNLSMDAWDRLQAEMLSQMPSAEEFRNAGIDPDDWARNKTALRESLVLMFLPPTNNDASEPKELALLRHIAKVFLPGMENFVAKNHFKRTGLCSTGSTFDQYFLGKVEDNAKETVINVHVLQKKSADMLIRKNLGENIEIQLMHLCRLVIQQINGQKGSLQTDGHANVAYIQDVEGVIWAVCAIWCKSTKSWHVDAVSVEDLNGWLEGCHILSRNLLQI